MSLGLRFVKIPGEMIEISKKSNNPYQVPSSNLADDSDGQQEWTRTAARLAERRDRASFCAYISAVYFSVFSTMILDVVLFGWGASLYGSIVFSTPIAYAVTLALGYPISKLTVHFQRKEKTVSKFISGQLNELDRWYSKPIITTILVPFASVVALFVFLFLEEYSLLIHDLDSSQLARRFSALLALPVMMPITHILVRRSQRKVRDLLEKMSESC
ncbi:MAG: hypothetical protein OXG24_05985 [Gammaproteobacteria bacterium]|nr:hypothetical protein [Gammaproteobacteria bacterium]